MSDARNAALDVMTGEYVTFIDSDDYVSDDYVEYLYKIIKESGVKLSVSSYQTFVDDSSAEICTNNPLFVKIVHTNDALTGMFYQQIFDTSAWAKMYHRSLFSDGIRYPKGWLYEDLPTTYRLMMKCDYIAFGNYRSYFIGYEIQA